MATQAPPIQARYGATRFYAIMAWIMSLVIVAGFSLNLAMGRSTFAVPAAYHVHGVIFMSWIGLYLAQHMTMARGAVGLHRSLGKLARRICAASASQQDFRRSPSHGCRCNVGQLGHGRGNGLCHAG